MPKLPLHDRLLRGLALLGPYIVRSDFSYVANSFPNGTPNHPGICYYYVELNAELPNTVAKVMKEMNWEYDDLDMSCTISH